MSDFLSNLVTRSLSGSDAVRPQLGTIYEATLENRGGFFAAEKEREATAAAQPPNERTEHLSRVESMWQRAPETRADIRPAPAPIALASAQSAAPLPPTQLQVTSEQHAETRPLKRDAPDSSRTAAADEPLPQTAFPEARAQKVIELIRRESPHSREAGKPLNFGAFPRRYRRFASANPRVESARRFSRELNQRHDRPSRSPRHLATASRFRKAARCGSHHEPRGVFARARRRKSQMSNTLAIGAVTATLRSLLETEIAHEGGGLRVTTLPPDKAQTFNPAADGGGWINLFLYHTQINPAWRNTSSPRQVKPNESGFPPLGLDLFYLVTAYEKMDGDSSVLAHRLLGRAMLVLHDHPLLGADEVRAVVPDNDLADQIERVRITPHAMSLEDLSKLWMIFQTGYRISAAYQVSLVLIDSRRSARTPLPVLTRGEDDSGPKAQADLVPPFPALLNVTLPDDQNSARVGDQVSLGGVHLDGDNVAVRFTTIRLTNPHVEPASGTEKEVKVTVPDLPAGSYTIAIRVSKAGQPDRFTNEWTVPNIGNTVNGSDAFIKVVAVDTTGKESFDEAEIIIPTNAIAGNVQFSMAAGQTFGAGEMLASVFTTSGIDPFMTRTEFYLEDVRGETRKLTGRGLGGLPFFSTDTARFVVAFGNTTNNCKYWYSPLFKIRPDSHLNDAPPTVSLTFPQAGNSFAPGGVIPITWTASDDEGLRGFDILASYNAARTWQPVAQNLPGTARSFDWQTAPGTGFSDVRLMVIAKDWRFQTSSDGSARTFVISSTGAYLPGRERRISQNAWRGDL